MTRAWRNNKDKRFALAKLIELAMFEKEFDF